MEDYADLIVRNLKERLDQLRNRLDREIKAVRGPLDPTVMSTRSTSVKLTLKYDDGHITATARVTTVKTVEL